MNNQIVKTNQELPVFSPTTDIIEREDGFYVYMDMPGAAKDGLNIDLQEDKLVISAEAADTSGEGETVLDAEFASGRYERAMTLSDIVDRDSIEASFEHGVLELKLPRAPKAQPRRIEVQQG